MHIRGGARIASLAMLVGLETGCIELTVPDLGIEPAPGTPFTVRGVCQDPEGDGACLQWVSETGILYYLFQDPGVDNDLFDRVTTPGAQSRLVLRSRDDLDVSCGPGLPVEVREVLEVVD